jgi:hypothetical protein
LVASAGPWDKEVCPATFGAAESQPAAEHATWKALLFWGLFHQLFLQDRCFPLVNLLFFIFSMLFSLLNSAGWGRRNLDYIVASVVFNCCSGVSIGSIWFAL